MKASRTPVGGNKGISFLPVASSPVDIRTFQGKARLGETLEPLAGGGRGLFLSYVSLFVLWTVRLYFRPNVSTCVLWSVALEVCLQCGISCLGFKVYMYRGISRSREHTPPGPYRRPMPRS